MNKDLVIETIDAALNEYKHNSLVDANSFRDVLLDIRQLLTRDDDGEKFWDIIVDVLNPDEEPTR